MQLVIDEALAAWKANLEQELTKQTQERERRLQAERSTLKETFYAITGHEAADGSLVQMRYGGDIHWVVDLKGTRLALEDDAPGPYLIGIKDEAGEIYITQTVIYDLVSLGRYLAGEAVWTDTKSSS